VSIGLFQGSQSAYLPLNYLCRLLSALIHDLRSTLWPSYRALLNSLLPLAPLPLPAATFQTLLSTLSSLFKYVLIPAAHSDGGGLPEIRTTWSSMEHTFNKCGDDSVRMLSEVWAGVVRRLKGGLGGPRDVLLEAMVVSAQNPGSSKSRVEEAVARALTEACTVRQYSVHLPCHVSQTRRIMPRLRLTHSSLLLDQFFRHCLGTTKTRMTLLPLEFCSGVY
jgi:hypothetical protein